MLGGSDSRINNGSIDTVGKWYLLSAYRASAFSHLDCLSLLFGQYSFLCGT